MPFKEQVIEHIDVMHDSASAIDSVNTIVNESGVLHAYNTDYQAVADLLRDNNVDTSLSVAVAGSGGMAKAVVAAVRDHRIHRRHRDRPQPASGVIACEAVRLRLAGRTR